MIRFIAGLAVASSLLAAASLPAAAQDGRQNEPGKFDFYVLSLSWSPSFCASAHDSGRSGGAQCGTRPYSFVVHGLWPQYEKGFPEYCEQPSPRLYHGIVSEMLDLMPAPHLIYNEWNKHGTCSGLWAARLFRDHPQGACRGENPARLCRSQRPAQRRAGCGGRRFHQGEFRPHAGRHRGGLRQSTIDRHPHLLVQRSAIPRLPRVVKRACRRDQITMPPVRGG